MLTKDLDLNEGSKGSSDHETCCPGTRRRIEFISKENKYIRGMENYTVHETLYYFYCLRTPNVMEWDIVHITEVNNTSTCKIIFREKITYKLQKY